jgi:hypothetical protein
MVGNDMSFFLEAEILGIPINLKIQMPDLTGAMTASASAVQDPGMIMQKIVFDQLVKAVDGVVKANKDALVKSALDKVKDAVCVSFLKTNC